MNYPYPLSLITVLFDRVSYLWPRGADRRGVGHTEGRCEIKPSPPLRSFFRCYAA